MDEKEGLDYLRKRGYEDFIKLDSGGQGNVYKTTKNKITYAAKVIRISEEVDKPSKTVTNLKRELSIIKNIKHPNCIRVEDIFRTKHKVYIIMDFMPNKTLIDEVMKNRNTSQICEWKAKIYFTQIINAIKYLHQNNIAHRDLKLDNILLDQHFNVKVCDFGFSKFVSNDLKTGKIEKSASYVGTPSYEPPELVMTTPYDPFKCDVWCLGICLFVLLNSDFPFNRKETKEKLYEKQMNRNYKFNQNIEQKLSKDVKDLIHQLLEPKPDLRSDIKQVCKHSWIPNTFRDLE